MCSLNELCVINAPETAHETTCPIVRRCQKCGVGVQQDKVILCRKNLHCETCFLNASRHKFRAALGKSKIIRRGDSVLIAHSGRPNSTALLHLIKTATEESVHKKLIFTATVVYIDDGAVKRRTTDERKSMLRSIAEQMRHLKFTGYWCNLARCCDRNFSLSELPSIRAMSGDDAFCIDTSTDIRLRNMFLKLTDDTARDELLRGLRRKVLISVARTLGCGKVLVADTATDLAIKVLGDMSTGRGSRLSVQVGFSDTRCPDVTFLRPIRDFAMLDVDRYLRCYALDPAILSPKYSPGFQLSVRNLTFDFLSQLDREFLGTVSTIYRTSQKLGVAESTDLTETAESCVLCDVPLDITSGDDQLSAQQATAFSRLVSSTKVSVNLSDNSSSVHCSILAQDSVRNRCEYTGEGFSCKAKSDIVQVEPTWEQFQGYLCYGCKFIFSDRNGDLAEMPAFLTRTVKERLYLASMRREITDFLL